jgi:hypothetical protein
MELLNRLFFQFAKANKKNGAFILFGTFFMVFLASMDLPSMKNLPVSVLIAVAACFAITNTFLIYWPIWILRVRKEARKKGLSTPDFIMSDDYLRLLKKHSASLEKE